MVNTHIVLAGPPGAGKGTLATELRTNLGCASLIAGDIFRGHVQAGSAVGRLIAPHMNGGTYAPDWLVDRVMLNELGKLDSPLVVIDGYPRTVPQAERLLGYIADSGHRLAGVFLLAVSRQELIRRLLLRGRTGHRNDDRRHIIERRLAEYEASSASVERFFRDRGLLLHVDGHGPPPDVAGALLAQLRDVPNLL